ncbi:Ubiquitin-activating enzyme E1 2 (AtUBA2) [Durusdinium trenchii]|uniref:E1 ubiquitin-activating enzyme n=1 Tax=Durusdinium trenchii TaxID=1381693 RepID=A0ABP0PRC7_9DINO
MHEAPASERAKSSSKRKTARASRRWSLAARGAAAGAQCGGRSVRPPRRTMDKEQLYSRQLFVLGKAAQERLQQSKVLIAGRLNGLGVEVAKNVMLAGVHALTLADDGPATVGDLASNFFLTASDVEQRIPRSTAVVDKLRELNANVMLNTMSEEEALRPDESGLGSFQVVVLVNLDRQRLEEIDGFCHAHQPEAIATVCVGSYGLYGYVFCDFGPSFTVVDPDGEQARQGIVLAVKQQDKAGPERLVICTADDKHHGLKDGDAVVFTGVDGLEALNDGEPRVVKSESTVNADGKEVEGQAFSIDAQGLDAAQYTGGGHFEQVKLPTTVNFEPLTASLRQPQCVVNDWNDMAAPQKLHALLLSLWDFERENGRLPAPGSSEDAAVVLQGILSQQENVLDAAGEPLRVPEESTTKLERLARGAAGQISPMAAFLGGVAGQEVLKACSGKFSPLHQWLHFSAVESLPQELPDATDFPSLELLNGHVLEDPQIRYAGQAAVFGWTFQQKLQALRCFMVGAGALGCETIKNMAMMGVSCGAGGKFVVTDMDAIELSNLNRQFLFRPRHVGQMKSAVAAEMSKSMNADFEVHKMESKVAPDTEDEFDDAFWQSVDLVINALDNVTARVYVDSKCLFHRKPLLESGTLGTKANTLPVIPDMTESYGSDPVQDDGGDDIPACTLHAYPNLIEHTLAWARDAVFEKLFNIEPMDARAVLEAESLAKFERELDRQPSTKLARLRAARAVLVETRPSDHPEKLFPYHVDLSGGPTLEICARLARMHFEELFVNKIKQLLHVHPLDKTVDDQGTKFWGGKRRPPSVQVFDAGDPLHMLFVASATFLYAKVYGIADQLGDGADRIASVAALLEKLEPLPPYEADDSVVVPENDEQAKELKEKLAKEAEEDAASTSERCAEELAALARVADAAKARGTISPQLFEKDDDTNGHMDLIFAAASIRARSYNIPLVDKFKAKMIVGRIIPAIATTTAMTTGVVALELYKIIHGHPLEQYRSSNINLAINSYATFEPTPCKVAYFGRPKYVREKIEDKILPVTIWTMVTLQGDLTVQEIIDHFLERFEFEVTTISTKGDVTLYNDMFGQEDRLELPISEVYRTVTQSDPPHFIILNVDGDFEELDDEEDDEEDDDEDDDDDEDEMPIPIELELRSVERRRCAGAPGRGSGRAGLRTRAFLRARRAAAGPAKWVRRRGCKAKPGEMATRLVPWVEKYRPKTVEDIAHQDEVVKALRTSIETGKVPHLLFYGPPGTGKTSTILAVAKQIYGKDHYKDRVLELNASDERGISVVRDKVKGFASTAVGAATVDNKKLPPFKLIILDEADSMSDDAQSALRRTMELYTRVTRFCLICNYVSRIIEPLASRCAKFRFQPLSSESFSKKILEISEQERLTLEDGALDTLVRVSKGDMRKGITLLQSSAQYNMNSVTVEAIQETAGVPSEEIMQKIWGVAMTNDTKKLGQVADELQAEGFSLSAIIRLMQEQLLEKDIDDLKKARVLMKLGEVDKAIEDGADEDLQLRALISFCMQQKLGQGMHS